MRKALLRLATALLLSAAASSAQAGDYADDRSEIENLTATYLIALDAGDLDTYVSTFTEDGVLNWAGGSEHGRAEIMKALEKFGTGRQPLPADATERPRSFHGILNHRIDVTGNTATSVSMWVGFTNKTPDKSFNIFEFGHYEDKLLKVDGKWLFSSRSIFNERIHNKALFYPEMGETDPRLAK